MLAETGIDVNGLFELVLPLTQPASRITLSNVPPFISDEYLIRQLSCHGKVISSIKKILSGCKSPLLRHVVSHRRQLHMILNNKTEEFSYRFIVRVDGFDYTLFATSSLSRCFNCGEEGHLRASPEGAAVTDEWLVPAAHQASRPCAVDIPSSDRAVHQVEEKQSQDGDCTEVSNERKSGAGEGVEMVVEATGELGEKGEVTGELGETGEVTGEFGETGEVLGELDEVTGELSKTGDLGETCKIGEVTGELGEVTGELGKTGELCEGGVAAEAGDGVSEQRPAPVKRRSKQKNVLIVVVGCKAGRLDVDKLLQTSVTVKAVCLTAVKCLTPR